MTPNRQQAFLLLAQEGVNSFRGPQKPTDGGKQKKKKKKSAYADLFYALLRSKNGN